MQDEPFLRAILAAPDDDLPRLVYADYLDETGRHDRAEFIRLQIESARLPPSPRRDQLIEREETLIKANGWDWARGRLTLFVAWKRGFEYRLYPCTRGIFNGETSLGELSRHPMAEELELGICCTDNEFRYMPDLPNLRRFSFGGNTLLSDASVPRIARWSTLQRLEMESDRITDQGLTHLTTLTKLVALDLSSTRVTDDGLRYLIALQSLEELNISDTQINGAKFGDLASLPRLRRLILEYTQIAENSLDDLARCKSLEELELSQEHSDYWYPQRVDTLVLLLLELPQVRVLRLGWGEEESPGLLLEACRQVPTLQELRFNGERLI